MSRDWYAKGVAASLLSAGMLCGAPAYADETPVPSRHQMMKDCMASQKATDSGRTKEDMRKACRDVTKTQKQNADRAAAAPSAAPHN